MLPREKDGVVDAKLKVRYDFIHLWLGTISMPPYIRFMGQRICVSLTFLWFHFKLDHTLKARVWIFFCTFLAVISDGGFWLGIAYGIGEIGEGFVCF